MQNVERSIKENVKEQLQSNKVLLLLGPRRVGKTVLKISYNLAKR